MDGLRAAGVVVGLHYAANLAHGVVHAGVPVPLTGGQTAFVALVVTVAPAVGLLLLWRDRVVPGWAFLAAVLAASFVFGVVFHYVLATPDHVGAVPAGPWQLPFSATAALVALVDGGGALAAARFGLRARTAGSQAGADATTEVRQ